MKKRVVLCILIIALLGFSAFIFSKKMFKADDNNALFVNKAKKRNEIINDYINSLDNFIEKIDFNKAVEVVSKENDRFNVSLFDYETGKNVDYKSLIKDLDGFYKKVKELLYLKYPKFIADVLINNENNVYYFKDNELVIYYYDYVIEPSPREELLLHVNYNEIKDYLNIDVKLDENYMNEDGSIIDNNKKIIAITFDDGPGSYTSSLIDILNNNKVKATFFMLGKNIANYRDVVKKASDSKMEIAYHSYAHKSFKRQKIEEIISELQESDNILKSITGEGFKYIRPPYGAINQEIKDNLNYPFILWSVDTMDWRYKDIDYLYNYTLENIKDGSIILFHDIHKTSVETIERLLPELYVEGYQVVTISQMASVFNQKLDNHQSYRYFAR